MSAMTKTRLLTTLSAIVGVAVGIVVSLRSCSVMLAAPTPTRVELACATLRADMETFP